MTLSHRSAGKGGGNFLLKFVRKASLKRSQWLLRHVQLQSASLRRSSYDRPWRAADTVGGIVVRLATLFDTKLGSVVGQEHDDAADAKLDQSTGR